MRKPALALLAAAALAGCAGLQDFARAAFQQPRLDFRSASLEALDLEAATVAFLFDVENPNAIGVDVARIAWAIEIERTRIASGDVPGGFVVPARGKAPVTFRVRLRWRDVPGIVSILGSGRDRIQYRLSGEIGLQTPIGLVSLPLSHEDGLGLPSLPRFAVEGISVRSASLTAVAFDVRLRLSNPNPFPLPAGRIDYSLAVNGAGVARAAGAALSSVPGGASAEVRLPVTLDVLSAGRAAADLARGAEVQVDLGGTAEIAEMPFPLQLRARVPARR